ncbi:ABC transporter ATP-binding protein [Cohaesibacter celericrescens]|uniref:Nitrate ABC transporter ATP-binding protein n=1 Tax=Cohaesibacter celericrescens TaxID=2067669 RepID=A0A2N5XNR5_9HYPH|nr:ABC transporter ATP-binding protein [Cohaesibacter celericrescens]PLW76057.1 nitrate ABC transporter ATP-binding protein [Cohaesibacter celericrescens]
MSTTPVPKLRLSDVSRQFDTNLALAPTNFDIAEGEFICVVGPSGCGKSTMFNIIAGVLHPSSGSVEVDGQDVTGKSGQVGYMLQKDLLLPWRTVLDNICLGSILHGRTTKAQRAEGVELAERYGLGDYINHYPSALSGGMRQRVALMRTLAMHRDVLLLDEPFGALDSMTRMAMQQWLLSVWKMEKRTVVFVTHDIDEAIFLADRVAVMSPRPGRIRDILPVNLPRPRGRNVYTAPEFLQLKDQIMTYIYDEKDNSDAA